MGLGGCHYAHRLCRSVEPSRSADPLGISAALSALGLTTALGNGAYFTIIRDGYTAGYTAGATDWDRANGYYHDFPMVRSESGARYRAGSADTAALRCSRQGLCFSRDEYADAFGCIAYNRGCYVQYNTSAFTIRSESLHAPQAT
jgi:hypothetical protein